MKRSKARRSAAKRDLFLSSTELVEVDLHGEGIVELRVRKNSLEKGLESFFRNK